MVQNLSYTTSLSQEKMLGLYLVQKYPNASNNLLLYNKPQHKKQRQVLRI